MRVQPSLCFKFRCLKRYFSMSCNLSCSGLLHTRLYKLHSLHSDSKYPINSFIYWRQTGRKWTLDPPAEWIVRVPKGATTLLWELNITTVITVLYNLWGHGQIWNIHLNTKINVQNLNRMNTLVMFLGYTCTITCAFCLDFLRKSTDEKATPQCMIQ